MKSDGVTNSRSLSYSLKERNLQDSGVKDTKTPNESNRVKSEEPAKRVELEEAAINNPEKVKEYIGENIQWRKLRFYQRQEGGQVYVDVVDRDTGEVLRTIPDSKMAEVSEKLQKYGAKKIDISG